MAFPSDSSAEPHGAYASYDKDEGQLHFYRFLLLTSATVYLGWWAAVHFLLPDSFNPFGSRIAVCLFFLSVFAMSFVVESVRRYISLGFSVCAWVLTIHFFYLFQHNPADINWVVGAYIAVIATSFCFNSVKALFLYAALVAVLSTALVFSERALVNTVFLPGMATILFFGYFGLRMRLELVRRSRDATQRAQSLFDAVFEGVVVHEEGRVLDHNESFKRVFGYERGDLLPKHLTEFVNEDSIPIIRRAVEEGMEASFEVTGIKKDGTSIPIEISSKVHFFNGRQLRLSAIIDLSERKKSERTRVLYEASQEALKIRDEFISIASHELKTPLTSLKLQTQMAKRAIAQGDPGVYRPEKVNLFHCCPARS